MFSSVLLASVLSFSTSQTDSTLAPPVELESVTIVADQDNRTGVSSGQLVLKAAALKRFELIDPHLALQGQPGIFTQPEDGWGLRLNIGIRGSGVNRSARITLMEDGVLAAPAPYSAPAAYYSPVFWKYQQVEVLKGAAALTTGPQSTAGAINLVLPTAQEGNGLRLQSSGGSYGTLLNSIQGQARTGKRAVLLYGGMYSRADGFTRIQERPTGAFNLADGYLKYLWHLDQRDRHHLEIYAGGTRERSAQTYLGLTWQDAMTSPQKRYLASERDSMAMNRTALRMSYTYRGNRGWVRSDLYRQDVTRNWHKLDQLSNGSTALGLGSILLDPALYFDYFQALQGIDAQGYTALLKANQRTYRSEGWQLKSQHSRRLEAHLFKLESGLRLHQDFEDRFQRMDTYALGDSALQRLVRGVDGQAGNRRDLTRAAASYARLTWSAGSWSAQTGVRAEYIHASRINWGNNNAQRIDSLASVRSNTTAVLLPGFTLRKTAKHWNYFAGVHRGMTPAGSGTGVLPEKSTTWEWGMNHQTLPIQIVAYQTFYDRLLGSDAASSGGSGTGELYNGGSARITGLETQAEQEWKQWRLNVSASFIRAVFTESFTSTFDAWGKVEAGDALPYIPQFQGHINLLWHPGRWEVAAQVNGLTGMRSSSALDRADLPANLVAHTSAAFAINEHFQIKASLQNVGNSQPVIAARPAGYRTLAPRMALLSLTYNL